MSIPIHNPSPTIYDVARTAGVSIATVSRVLNDPQKVNTETRSAVIHAIETLGYIPKVEARARAMKENRRIGVITPFFTAPSFVQRLRGVSEGLANTHYELVIYTVDTVERLTGYLETLPLSKNLDGLVVISLQFPDSLASHLVNHHLETVVIEFPHPTLNSVEIDNVQGGRIAAEYLLKKGHQKFAFLGDSDQPEYSVHPISHRLVGFRQRLQEAGYSLPEHHVYLVPYDVESTRRHTRELLRRPDPPTAIFAATDLQAMGVMRAVRDLHMRIPEDVAVLGFDDLDIADYIGLTTITQHLDESGRIAVELLLSKITDPSRPVRHVQLPLTVIERDSA